MHALTQYIETLRDSARVFIAATGGGAGLQKLLWDVPGASSFLAGSVFTYSKEATDEFLGFKPEHYCSGDTAVDLAMQAFCMAFKPGGNPPIGIGLTASVASTKAHRGDHRVFVAAFSEAGCFLDSYVLQKGEGHAQREKDGETCDLAGLIALLHHTGQTYLQINDLPFKRELADTLARERFFERPYFRVTGAREKTPDPASGEALSFLPGAFNPPHEGHFGMAHAFVRDMNKPVTYMIASDPPHKESLSVAEMIKRSKLLRGYDFLFTTGDPLYIDKARRFPGARFIVGADAFARIFDPVWCQDPKALADEFQALRVFFFVCDRVIDGKLVTLSDLSIPTSMPCRTLHGRWDVSSSEIRSKTS